MDQDTESVWIPPSTGLYVSIFCTNAPLEDWMYDLVAQVTVELNLHGIKCMLVVESETCYRVATSARIEHIAEKPLVLISPPAFMGSIMTTLEQVKDWVQRVQSTIKVFGEAEA